MSHGNGESAERSKSATDNQDALTPAPQVPGRLFASCLSLYEEPSEGEENYKQNAGNGELGEVAADA